MPPGSGPAGLLPGWHPAGGGHRAPITRGGQPKLQNKSKIMIPNLSNYLKNKEVWRMPAGPEVDTDRLHETIHASMSAQPLWRPQEYAFDEVLVQL